MLDTQLKPLNPVHPGRARILLQSRQATVYKRYPFTIILKRAIESASLDPLRLKIDPGSKTTGLAIIDDASGKVIFAAELAHRGEAIKQSLERRRAVRQLRRQRQTRYRKPRFQNRRRKQGWLPPSLESRLSNITTWIDRLRHLAPITAISQELVKFDMQALDCLELTGVEYQQGTLAGYEVREYLLAKWDRRCAYCGAKNVPLQVEHIHPRANGGTNRISNLTLACEPCNTTKGRQDVRVFLASKPTLLNRILAQAKAPLKDAAAVNATRWELYRRLQQTNLPVECGSGGLTKYNRSIRQLPKTHWLDAACVGKSTPQHVTIDSITPLLIIANGHGSRQMCQMDRYGFPRTGPKQKKRVHGFQTGDMVRAVVSLGKKNGVYVGRVAVRANGWFNITTATGTIQGISHRYCSVIHPVDGYSYQKGATAVSLHS